MIGLSRIVQRVQFDHSHIALAGEASILVEDVRDTPAHPRAKIPTGFAQYYDQSTRHVLASMVANSLDHRGRAAVADGEAFARYAAKEGLPARGAIQRDVSDDNIFLGFEGGIARRPNSHKAAGQALAAIVIGVTLEIECDTRREPRAETLSRRSLQMDLYRVRRQSVLSVPPRYFRRQHSAGSTIHIANRQMNFDRLLMFECLAAKFD